MRRPLLYKRLAIAGGGLLVLFWAILSVPARVVPLLLPDDRLVLSAVSGSLRHGNAGRVLIQTAAGYVHLGDVTWRLSPWSLLRLAPRVELQGEWGDQRFSVVTVVSRDALKLHDLDASFAASIAKHWLPVELSGRVSVVFDRVTVKAESIEDVAGRVVWQGAAWRSPRGERPLGDYVALLTSAETRAVDIAVDTLAGPVVATGGARVAPASYSTNLTIAARAGALDAELAQALSLIASPADNGYLLRLDGQL